MDPSKLKQVLMALAAGGGRGISKGLGKASEALMHEGAAKSSLGRMGNIARNAGAIGTGRAAELAHEHPELAGALGLGAGAAGLAGLGVGAHAMLDDDDDDDYTELLDRARKRRMSAE